MVSIRGEEVLLPTTIVGSYPRAQFLEGKVFPLDGVNAPEFPSFRARTLYRNAVALAIKDMTDAGLDVVTDGCQHYESDSDYEQGEIFHFYLDRLEGFVPYGDNISAGHFNNVPVYKPTVVGPIGWRRPIFKPIVEAVTEQTGKPAKIQAAVGPATMSALITDQHYGDIGSLSKDLARALNVELRDMVSRGVDIIQFAEVLTFFDPADWVIEAINIALDGIDAYKVIHICYGQQEGQPGVTELRGPKLFPWLWDLNCDQIQYEMSSHGFHQSDIDAISTIPADKDFGVGVVNGKNLVAESPEQVAAGIRRVLEVVPPERVMVYTDCTLDRHQAHRGQAQDRGDRRRHRDRPCRVGRQLGTLRSCPRPGRVHSTVRLGSRPNARRRRYSVDRDIPRAAAACIRFPPHSRRASTMASRSSVSSRVSVRRPRALM